MSGWINISGKINTVTNFPTLYKGHWNNIPCWSSLHSKYGWTTYFTRNLIVYRSIFTPGLILFSHQVLFYCYTHDYITHILNQNITIRLWLEFCEHLIGIIEAHIFNIQHKIRVCWLDIMYHSLQCTKVLFLTSNLR